MVLAEAVDFAACFGSIFSSWFKPVLELLYIHLNQKSSLWLKRLKCSRSVFQNSFSAISVLPKPHDSARASGITV